MDLINRLSELSLKLDQAIRTLAKFGKEYAESERDYKVALSQKALMLRDSGMAVTLIDKVVYGEKEVADKRFKRDFAEVMYKSALENINSIKLQIRILDNQLSREWTQSK